jgi:carboxymethylenebutenolidase
MSALKQWMAVGCLVLWGVSVQAENLVSTVSYDPAQPKAQGTLVVPDQSGPKPALILIHEWWGLNDNIRDFAQEFADLGYVALAVDMYNGEATQDPQVARKLAGSVRGNLDGAFGNLRSAIEYLQSHPEVDASRVAAVGWCFGGGWAYQMAKNDLGVRASVIYYGQFNPEDDLNMMRASIMGHFGAEDRSIKVDDVKTFQATLKTQGGDHEIFIYENAGHAFANKDNTRAYREGSAKQAWDRTTRFLKKHL